MKALILITLLGALTYSYAQSSYSAADQGNEENKKSQLDTGHVNKDVEKTSQELKVKPARKGHKKKKPI